MPPFGNVRFFCNLSEGNAHSIKQDRYIYVKLIGAFYAELSGLQLDHDVKSPPIPSRLERLFSHSRILFSTSRRYTT